MDANSKVQKLSFTIVKIGLFLFFLSVYAFSKENVRISVGSGGISLGNYQGGYLYGKQFLNDDSAPPEYWVHTGTSAGAINTLASLYYTYHTVKHGDTLGYNPYSEWLKISWDKLTENYQADSGTLFSDKAVKEGIGEVVKNILTPPTRNNADSIETYLGFAITRFLPPIFDTKLKIHKPNVKVILGMRWLENSNLCLPKISCYQMWSVPMNDLSDSTSQLIFDFGQYGTDSNKIAQVLADVARLSGSFPVAFAPSTFSDTNGYRWLKKVEVKKYALIIDSLQKRFPINLTGLTDKSMINNKDTPLGDIAWGRWGKTQNIKFSDGGIYDNEPIYLATRIVEYGIKNEDQKKQDSINIQSIDYVRPTNYLFEKDGSTRIKRGMLSEWVLYFMRGVDASELELLKFRETHNDSVHLNETSFPLASEHFGHFGGFFNRSFRDFDFMIGFLDAMETTKNLENALVNGSLDSLPEIKNVLKGIMESPYQKKGDSKWLESLRDTSFGFVKVDDNRCLEKDKYQVEKIDSFTVVLKDLHKHLPFNDNSTSAIIDVWLGSLERMKGTLISYAKEGPGEENAADQLKNFYKGWLSLHPQVAKNGITFTDTFHSNNLLIEDFANQLYTQAEHLLDNDYLGTGNSFLYPWVFYHSRFIMGYAFGIRPIFGAPFVNIEAAERGVQILQGYYLRNLFKENKHWSSLRFELGVNPFVRGDSMKVDGVFKFGFDATLCNYVNFIPSMEWHKGSDDLKTYWNWKLSVIDFINLGGRFNIPKGNHHFYMGVQTGFNILQLFSGVKNGANKDRMCNDEKECTP